MSALLSAFQQYAESTLANPIDRDTLYQVIHQQAVSYEIADTILTQVFTLESAAEVVLKKKLDRSDMRYSLMANRMNSGCIILVLPSEDEIVNGKPIGKDRRASVSFALDDDDRITDMKASAFFLYY
jgi:hypothetical protein